MFQIYPDKAYLLTKNDNGMWAVSDLRNLSIMQTYEPLFGMIGEPRVKVEGELGVTKIIKKDDVSSVTDEEIIRIVEELA